MYTAPVSNRLHIGIFGRRNVGKSSLINALTGQSLAIVSDIAGTTTDPVRKSMEILPIGPCMLIDTAGIDDIGELGKKRIEKTRTVLRKTDVGILLVDPGSGFGEPEKEYMDLFSDSGVPCIIVLNKVDISDATKLEKDLLGRDIEFLKVSALTGKGIEDLKLKLIERSPASWQPIPLVRDIIKEKDIIVMVCPVDSAMPQGRLILPQVQVLREVLDANATAFVCKDTELKDTLSSLKKKPDLVITDSQVFQDVKDNVEKDIKLTSFSIVYARQKGDIQAFLDGVAAVEGLSAGDEILIAEACTHHAQPEDIGRCKIPTWLQNYTGKDLNFEVMAGGDFPEDLEKYKMIISCGGCMVNRREMMYRVEKAKKAGVAITNYGILISYFSGILERTLEPFREGVIGFNTAKALAE